MVWYLSKEEESKFYNNFKIPTSINNYKFPDGKIGITVNEDKEIFYLSIKDNIELNQEF